MKAAIIIAAVALLSACSNTVSGNYCDIDEPIRPTPEDVQVISDGLVTQILSHNETGAELCGWQK